MQQKDSARFMTNTFHEYAQYYDLLYQDKDYPGEAHFVERLLGRYVGKAPVQTEILDLACGTGRHAQELASIGYRVEGSDLSADMVAIATSRAAKIGLNIRYYNESFQSCNLIDRRFDAVTAMFSAIGYLTDYKDLKQSLSNIRHLLREDGVFIFDFWNGNAVLGSHSPTRVRRVENADQTVIRISNTVLDEITQRAEVNFEFMLLKAGHIIQEFSETHLIRYFFPQEMVDLLSANGFDVLHRCPFLREDGKIDPNDWNLTYVVRPCK